LAAAVGDCRSRRLLFADRRKHFARTGHVVTPVVKSGKSLIAFFTIAVVVGFFALGKASYALWMCAHPLYQSAAWTQRFYVWVAFVIVCFSLCLICLFVMWRTRNK
jgi:hypothetical protein